MHLRETILIIQLIPDESHATSKTSLRVSYSTMVTNTFQAIHRMLLSDLATLKIQDTIKEMTSHLDKLGLQGSTRCARPHPPFYVQLGILMVDIH